MPVIESFQTAYAIYQNRDKLWKISKWALAIIITCLIILYLIIATVAAVLQGIGKVSDSSLQSENFSQFEYFSYKTINGDTWYEFKHAYIFPTLGKLTQGVILEVSKDGLKHIAWDIADTTSRTTEVKAFSDGTVAAVKDNMLVATTRRWKFCDNGVGICWYQVSQPADIQIGCGYEVIIKHPDGLTSDYCHLASMPTLKAGDPVSIGDTVGIQGSTGWATGKHLHFDLSRGGIPIDPSYAFSQTSLSNWGQ